MARTSTPTEILYYGSTRQEQYWENEDQTLRIARNISSPMWLAYRKQSGTYQPFPARPRTAAARKRGRHEETESLPLAGRSAEDVVSQLKKFHKIRVFLEQSSGERVLAFLDPNQGGAPVMTDPGIPQSQQSHLHKGN